MKLTRILALGLLAVGLAFTSCDDRVTPLQPEHPDEHEHDHDHDHDHGNSEVAKIQLILSRGHFHGTKLHADIAPTELKHFSFEQHITLEKNDEGKWIVAKDSPWKHFVVQGGIFEGENGGTHTYAFQINYFDEHGHDITNNFVDGDAADHHQHFFFVKDIKPYYIQELNNAYKADDSFYTLKYYDTAPWNKTMNEEGTTLVGENNPVGQKGVFSFWGNYVQFNMEVQLFHINGSKKDASGAFSPFFAPSKELRSRSAVDLTFQFPIIIYSDSNDYLDAKTYEEAKENENDRRLMGSFSKALGITEEEAFHDLYWLVCGDRPHDLDKGFYL